MLVKSHVQQLVAQSDGLLDFRQPSKTSLWCPDLKHF